jgi:putative membrane protein
MAEQPTQNMQHIDNATRMAFDRTRAAYERTMMAWIRTGTSLITFGFTIYKFFQLDGLEEQERKNHLIGPRQFAVALVSIGLFSLLLATIENRQNIRALGAEYAGKQRSLAVIVAAMVSFLGVAALVAMVFRQ